MKRDKEMNKELEHLHQLELLLASEVLRICEKHGLKIVMLAGTFLGAIRHKGFIPWDDDMDFGMPRADFERFKKICEVELNREKFFIQTDDNDKYYPFNFIKLRLNGTHVIEEFSSSADVHNGIYIDVFPIDDVASNSYVKFIQFKGFWFFRNLLWIKCGYGDREQKQKTSYKIGKILSLFFSVDFLKKAKNFFITIGNRDTTEYVVVSDGSYGLEKETFPKKWLNEIDLYQFEDKMIWGFRQYQDYLTHLYGNYMELPPENKRNHHNRLKVDFGPYKYDM